MDKNQPALRHTHIQSGASFPAQIEFKSLAKDAPVMLWLTNETGEIIFTNTRWDHFIGTENVEKYGGDAWYMTLHPDDKEHCLKVFEDAFLTHRPFSMEYRLRRVDDTYRYVFDCGEPFLSDDGKFQGFIGSSTDITELKEFQEELSRSHQQMEEHSIAMRLINEMNSYLQVCRSLEETYPVITHYIEKLFPTHSGGLYLLNETKTIVESMVMWGNHAEYTKPLISPDDCWALRQGKIHTVLDISTHGGLSCQHLTIPPEHGYTCVPLMTQGGMIGMLHIQFSVEKAPPLHEDGEQRQQRLLNLINMAADNLGLSLASLKLREALRNQSVRDPLTELFNRRYMEETFARELSACKRAQSELEVMMIDIDHFKQYNDTYGHDVGDYVLKQVADYIKDSFRSCDVPCRYGGEEFLVVTINTTLSMMEKRAEALRAGIEKLDLSHQGKPIKNVTISIGVASYPANAETVYTLIKAADLALYEAKESGRNKVVVSTANMVERPE